MNPFRRARRRLLGLALLVGALVVSQASPAFAEANAEAYALQVTVANTITVGPVAPSTFPTGGTNTVLGITVPSLLSSGTLTGETTGDSDAGTSTATGSVENLSVTLGGIPLVSLVGLMATAVEGTCTGNPDGSTSGSTTLVNANLTLVGLPILALDANPAPNTPVVSGSLSGIASIVLNEQTTVDGQLTVNAIHITLLGGNLADIIIGHAVCGPNSPVVPVPFIAPEIAAGLGVVGVLGVGAYTVRRRMRRTAIA